MMIELERMKIILNVKEKIKWNKKNKLWNKNMIVKLKFKSWRSLVILAI